MTQAEGLSGSLDRAIALLERAARGGGLAFNEATEALGAVPSTVSRLLKALVDTGLLAHGEHGRYSIGQRLRGLAGTLNARPDLDAEAVAVADALAAASGESAAVFVPVDDGVRLIAKHEPPERFHYMPIGRTNTGCDRHGFCHVRAAWWDVRTARTRFAAQSDGDPTDWLARLPALRETGWLANRQDDQPGIARIAAAVRDRDGGLLALVGISGIAAAWSAPRLERLVTAVRRAADDLAHRLGQTP